MKHRCAELFRKWQYPLYYAAAVAPASVMIFAFLVPDKLLWGWLFPVAYMLLCMPAPLIPGTYRRIYGFVAAGLMAVVGFLLVSPLTEESLIYLAPFGYAAIILPTIPTAGYAPEEGPPKWLLWVGMVLHSLEFALLRYTILAKNYPPIPISIAISAVFALFFVCALLFRNRTALVSAGMGGDAVPYVIKKKNLMLLIAFSLAALVLSFIPGMSTLIIKFLALMWYLFGLLGDLLSGFKGSEDPTQSTTAVVETEESIGELLPSKPNAIVEAIEPFIVFVFRYLIIAGLIGFAIVLVVVLVRAVKKMVRWSVSALMYYHTASTEDYEDEISDTREDEDASAIKNSQLPKRRFFGIHRMTPREQIRRRYQWLLKKNPQWHTSRTARENLSDERSVLYEQARYSDKELTKEEAEKFLSQTKQI